LVTRRLARQVVMIGFALALLAAPLSTALATRTPDNFHWARKTSEFTLLYGKNMSKAWKPLFRRSLSEWNRNGTVTLEKTRGGTSGKRCRATKGRVEVCSGRYFTDSGRPEKWLGLTRLFFNKSGTHVDAATVQMNDYYFNGNTQYNNHDARRHTMCHELGHTLGLHHPDPPTKSCMNNSQFAVQNYIKPIRKDFRDIAAIYKHKDSTSTVGKASSTRNQDSQRTQSEGFFAPTSLPAVPSGLDSDETVTIQTLDDGSRVVTFITWAEEEPRAKP
jgi:hypothetical protein